MFFSKKTFFIIWFYGVPNFTGWCADLAGVAGWLNQGTKPSLSLTPPCLSTGQAGFKHRPSALEQFRGWLALSPGPDTLNTPYVLDSCARITVRGGSKKLSWLRAGPTPPPAPKG
jgi:hypothetical protein